MILDSPIGIAKGFSIFDICLLCSLVLYSLISDYFIYFTPVLLRSGTSLSYSSHILEYFMFSYFTGLGAGKEHQWLVWTFLLSFCDNSWIEVLEAPSQFRLLSQNLAHWTSHATWDPGLHFMLFIKSIAFPAVNIIRSHFHFLFLSAHLLIPKVT